jgi:hypothetical protein
MQNNFFYIPKQHRWANLLAIAMLVFICAYFIFPWMVSAQFGNSWPRYVQYDFTHHSRDIFWVFETFVFLLNCWIFSWTRWPKLKYYTAGFVFVIGWLATITDFRYPCPEIVWGTGFLCALYYLLVLVVQQIELQWMAKHENNSND